MERKTKTEMYTAIKAQLTDPEQIAFIDNQIALIKNKSAKRGLTQKQKDNLAIKKEILATLSYEQAFTISELQELNKNLTTHSNQKLSSLLAQLVDEHKAVRVVEKRVTMFMLPTTEEE